MVDTKCTCGAKLVEVNTIKAYVYRSVHDRLNEPNTGFRAQPHDGCRVRFAQRLHEPVSLAMCPECTAQDQTFKFERTEGEPARLCPKGCLPAT
jgi:hypothetical protein